MLGTVAVCEKLRNLDIGGSTTRGGVGLMLYQDALRVGLADQMPFVAIRAAIKLSRARRDHRHHSIVTLLLCAKHTWCRSSAMAQAIAVTLHLMGGWPPHGI